MPSVLLIIIINCYIEIRYLLNITNIPKAEIASISSQVKEKSKFGKVKKKWPCLKHLNHLYYDLAMLPAPIGPVGFKQNRASVPGMYFRFFLTSQG